MIAFLKLLCIVFLSDYFELSVEFYELILRHPKKYNFAFLLITSLIF
jgi:hypothetical protein